MAKKQTRPKSLKAKRDVVQEARSYEEIQAIKTALWASPAAQPSTVAPVSTKMEPLMVSAHGAALAAAGTTVPTLVAEGDSWFDYQPGFDVLDNLKYYYSYNIIKLSTAGDTLENMVFGTGLNRDYTRTAVQLNTLIQSVITYQPKAVLFSGGGNDLAGEPLEAFLNHKDSAIQPLLRLGQVGDVIDGQFRAAYQTLSEKVWAVCPQTHVVTHGYAHAIPDGRGVFNFPFGFHFVGPWLKPAFSKKNILDLALAAGIIRQLIDRFNDMLSNLQAHYRNNSQGRFHYIDLRRVVMTNDWVNELHLSHAAYKKVAARFHEVLNSF
jgi:hypothetical protein